MRVITELKEKITKYCYDDDFDAIFLSLKHNSEEFHLISCNKSVIRNNINEIPISYLEKIDNYKNCCIKEYSDLYGSIIPKKVDIKLSFIKQCTDLNEALKYNLRIVDLEEQIVSYYNFIIESLDNLNAFYNKNKLSLNENTILFYNDCVNNALKFINEEIRSEINKGIIAKKYNINDYDNKLLLTTKNNTVSYNFSADDIDNYNLIESLAILYGFIGDNKEIIIIPFWVYKLITKNISNYFNEIYFDIENSAHEIAGKLYKESNYSDLYYSYKEAYNAAIAVDK